MPANAFLPDDEANVDTAPVIERSRLYEALVRTDNAFMLTLFASLEADVTVRSVACAGRRPGSARGRLARRANNAARVLPAPVGARMQMRWMKTPGLPAPYAHLASSGSEAVFWKELALLMHAQGTHLIEFAVAKALALVHDREYARGGWA